MLRSMLRGMARLVPLGIVVGFLAVAVVVFLWQNHTTVSCEGDFTLATDGELVMAHRWDAEQNESLSDGGLLRSESRPVAKKFVLRKRAGLNFSNRGHSACYEATFPEFPATSSFLRDVNRQVGTSHTDAAAEFARADWPLVWDEFRDPSAVNREWTANVTTDVVQVTDRAVCLLELHWQYTGGAHGNSCYVARSFIEENGQARRLKLAELFEPSSNWSDRLVELCTEQLRRQGASSLTPREDADAEEISEFKPAILEADDLATFALAPSGLWFFFAPYHVGCHAEGCYSVKVPYSEVQDCIPDGSPARLFMRTDTR